MVLKKVIYDNRKVIGKDGKEHKTSMFFLETESGARVPVKPIFSEDYPVMDFLAKTEHDSSVKGKQDEKSKS